MQSINTLSLVLAVNDWLANTRHPRILHVFDRACNLINERKEVLSIVTPQIGNGPFNLVVEEDILFSDHLNVQSPISIRARQIHLGDLIINTEDTRFWFPRPEWERLHTKRDNILSQIMSLRGRWFSARSNVLANLEIASSQSANALLATTLPITICQSLTSSLGIADIPSSRTAARQLAGLGIGLTPSGDDFMMGALYAAWIVHPPEIASVLAREIADTAIPLTTSLSAAWLRAAGRGEAGILWHELFNSLLLPSASLQSPISKILSVGETSGADALAGFFGVMSAFKERIISECPS